MKLSKNINLILSVGRLILTIVLLVFIFNRISFDNVLQVLYTANKNYLFLALSLVLVQMILKKYKRYLVGKELHGKKIDPNSLTFMGKLSELWTIVFFVLLGGLKLLTGYNSILIILAVAVILLLLYQFRNFNNNITCFVPFKFLKAIVRSLTLVSWPLSNIILILSFLTMSVYFLQAYILLSAFQPVAASTILMVFPFILLTNLVPVTIGSLGIREGAAIYLLSQFGIPAGAAVSVSLLLFLFDTVIPGVLGSLFFYSQKTNNLLTKVSSQL